MASSLKKIEVKLELLTDIDIEEEHATQVINTQKLIINT